MASAVFQYITARSSFLSKSCVITYRLYGSYAVNNSVVFYFPFYLPFGCHGHDQVRYFETVAQSRLNTVAML